MVALSIHLCGVVTYCRQIFLDKVAGGPVVTYCRHIFFGQCFWWPLASTFMGLSHIADIYFWTMLMVVLSIHLWGCHRSRKRVRRLWVYVSEGDVVTSLCICVCVC